MVANRQSVKRSLGATLKYRGWTAFIAFVVAVSAALWGLGHSKRIYRVESGLTVRAGVQPEVAQAAREQAAASLRKAFEDINISLSDSKINAAIKTDNPNQGYVLLSNALESAARAGNQVALKANSDQRELLTARVTEVTAQFNAAQSRVEKLEQAHPELADNNSGPSVRLERITARQEERSARRKVVEEQIQRTEGYAKKLREVGASQNASAQTRAVDAATAAVDRDPEVMQLAAQMQLIDDQLEEQLTRLRRTEQHPYVTDLRSRQAALQQKLSIARQRAGAGQPPPAAAVAAANSAGANTPNMVLQAAEFQLQQLVAERDQLTAELAQLKEQETSLRTLMETLKPVRDQWRTAKEKSASLKQDRDTAEARLRAFDETSRASVGLPISVNSIDSGYKTPIWPRTDVMLLAALAAGCVAAVIAAIWREKTDRTYQTPERFAALTGAPVIGVVDEIYSPKQWRSLRLWKWIGRPAVVAALLAYPVMSALALMK